MEFLIIPLIALAVWILQYVFKGPEDNKPQQQQGKGRAAASPPRPGSGRPRRQVNDLDRFLEETRKRKQQEERKPVVIAEAVPANPTDRAEAVERERRAQSARPRPQATPAARPVPPPERRPQRVEQPRRPGVSPSPRETPSAVPLEAVLVEPIPSLPPPPPRPATAGGETVRAPREAAQAASSVKRTISPVLVEVVRKIRQPQGALLALVLHEILDAPVSRRNGMK
jgi:hypothetical protein